MTALRAPALGGPTTQEAALAEARRLRTVRDAQRPGCTAWHYPGEVCIHPRLSRGYDEAREADEGSTPYVDSEARAAREAQR